MRKVLTVAGTILLVALVAAGSFWGGMQFQSGQTNQAQANFLNARGGQEGGQFPTEGQLPPEGQTPGFRGGGGTTGQVKSIDDEVMTLSTAEEIVTVHLSETTQIQETVSAAIADLQPGMRVIVSGQSDDNGTITANRIQVLNDDFTGSPYPSPAGTEP